MTTAVTKESLAARIAELESGARSLKEDYTLTAYKMLLATMEAEPVYQVQIYGQWTDTDKGDFYCTREDERRLLYAAPPSMVVPEEITSAIEWLKQSLVDCNRYNYCFDAVTRVENACRAAMINGGKP